jgi:hypothetical protein
MGEVSCLPPGPERFRSLRSRYPIVDCGTRRGLPGSSGPAP